MSFSASAGSYGCHGDARYRLRGAGFTTISPRGEKTTLDRGFYLLDTGIFRLQT